MTLYLFILIATIITAVIICGILDIIRIIPKKKTLHAESLSERKIFTDVMPASSSWQQCISFIVPAFFLTLFFLVWKSFGFIITQKVIITLLIALLALVVYGVFLYRWEKKGISKILVDDNGITFKHLFSKTHVPWNQIKAIESKSETFKSEIIELKTLNRDFSFSLGMKEENQSYPQIKLWTIEGAQWEYEDGSRKSVTIENCPLYIEIQKHLQNRPQ